MDITRNISDLWMFLSDAWTRLDDKSVIEGLWETTASGMDMLFDKTMAVQNSRSLEYMPALIDGGPMTHTFVCSGAEELVNVLETPSGLFKYYLEDWTLSIPTMLQEYTCLGSGLSHTYYEGVDYVVSGMNTLVWLTTPVWDDRYSDMGVFTVSMPVITQVNPILVNTWSRIAALDIEVFNSYDTYQTDTLENKYKHFKYFIWALVTKQLDHPTVKTVRDALSIAAGLPFAYNAGTITYTFESGMYTVHVGDDTYRVPSGFTFVTSGTLLEKFDPLVTGINVWDYYNNPTLINQHANALTKYNTIIIENTLSSLNYNQSFYENYRSKLLPVHMHQVYLG